VGSISAPPLLRVLRCCGVGQGRRVAAGRGGATMTSPQSSNRLANDLSRAILRHQVSCKSASVSRHIARVCVCVCVCVCVFACMCVFVRVCLGYLAYRTVGEGGALEGASRCLELATFVICNSLVVGGREGERERGREGEKAEVQGESNQ
jgi:hypothetical protein